jgi:hypothetical protein
MIGPATAHTSLLASAERPFTAPTPVKEGLETTLQLVPSQCSIKSADKLLIAPAAHASVAETAVTVCRKAPCPTLGLATTLQFAPFQCSIKVVMELPAV